VISSSLRIWHFFAATGLQIFGFLAREKLTAAGICGYGLNGAELTADLSTKFSHIEEGFQLLTDVVDYCSVNSLIFTFSTY